MSSTPHKRNPMGATTMVNQKTRTHSLAGEQAMSTKGASAMSATSAPVASTGPKKTYVEEQYSRDPFVASAVDGLEAAATSLSLFNMALREAVKAGQRADSYQYSRMGRMFGAAKKDMAEAEELMRRLTHFTNF